MGDPGTTTAHAHPAPSPGPNRGWDLAIKVATVFTCLQLVSTVNPYVRPWFESLTPGLLT